MHRIYILHATTSDDLKADPVHVGTFDQVLDKRGLPIKHLWKKIRWLPQTRNLRAGEEARSTCVQKGAQRGLGC